MGRHTKNKLDKTMKHNFYNKKKIKYTQVKPVTFENYLKLLSIISVVIVFSFIVVVLFI